MKSRVADTRASHALGVKVAQLVVCAAGAARGFGNREELGGAQAEHQPKQKREQHQEYNGCQNFVIIFLKNYYEKYPNCDTH